MSDYLPPVVIEIIGDDSSLIRTIGEDQAALAAFAKQTFDATLGVEEASFEKTLADAKMQLLALTKTVNNAKLGVDGAEFYAQLTKIKATLDALSSDEIVMDLNTGPATAKVLALKALMDSLKGDVALSVAGGILSKSGLGGTAFARDNQGILELLGSSGAAAASGGTSSGLLGLLGLGGGKGGGGAGLAALLGIGTGFGGLATSGLLAGAGLGLQGVATTALGIGASGLGALGGAGLLGLGSLGVMGVGMGTDMAGIGQAAGDIKQVTAAQNALNQAVFMYGPASQQAAQAQKAYNYTLASFSPVAQQAVVNTANIIQGFKQMFDQATGAAEATGAQIIGQLVQTAEAFLPTIGQFAAKNMTIIQSSLQPLLAWLKGPGLQVFTELENIFTKNLPAGMDALTQGVEFFIKTLGYLAPMTGHITQAIDKFLQKANSPTGFAKWEADINKLVGIFHVWWGLLKSVGTAIYELFHSDAGTGTAIIKSLTDMINKFNAWAKTTQGGDALKSLFAAHKQEILGIIKILGTLAGAFGQLDIAAEPVLMNLVTGLSNVINVLLKTPIVGQLLAAGTAVLLFAKHIGMLKTLMGGVQGLFLGSANATGLFAKAMALIGKITGIQLLVGQVKTLAVAIGDTLGLKVLYAVDAVKQLSLGMKLLETAGILAVAAGIYLLIQHFGALKGLMIAGGIAAAAFAVAFWGLDAAMNANLIGLIVIAIAGLIAGIVYLATHWSQVWSDIKQWTSDAVNFLRSPLGTLGLLLLGPLAPLAFLALHWNQVWHDMKGIGSFVQHLGSEVINGLIHGLESAASDLWSHIKHIGSDIVHWFGQALGVASPSRLTQPIGADTTLGVALGITQTSGQAVAAAKTVASQIIAAFGSLSNAKRLEGAVQTLAGTFKQLSAMFTDFANAAKNAANSKQSIAAISTALKDVGAKLPAIVKQIQSLDKQMSTVAKSKGITELTTTLSNIAKMFQDLGTAAKDSKDITAQSLQDILQSLKALVAKASDIKGAISTIVTSFHSLDASKKAMSALQGLTSLMNDLSGIFNSLASTSKASSQVTSTSLANILQSLKALVAKAPDIVSSVKTIKSEFDKMGNLQTVNSQLSALDQMFQSLSSVFNDLSSASQAAAGVTPDAIGQITTAIQNLVTQLGKLPAQVNTLGTQTVQAFQTMMDQSVNVITGAQPRFIAAGEALMQGLSQGINLEAGAVATAAANAASQALAAAKAATQTHSPSLAFAQLGSDWMTGLMQGIQQLESQVSGVMSGAALQALDQTLQAVSSVLNDFASVASAAGNLTSESFQQMSTGIGLVVAQAPQMVTDLANLESAVAQIGGVTPNLATNLTSLDQVLQPLAAIFGDVSTASQNMGSVTSESFTQMFDGINLIINATPQIITGLSNLETAVAQIGGVTPNLATNVTSFEQVMSPLAQLLGDIGTAATNSQALTSQSITQMLDGFQLLVDSAPQIEAGFTALEKAFSGFGDYVGATGNANDLNNLLTPISGIFQNLGSAISNAGSLTQEGVQNFEAALAQLAGQAPQINAALQNIAQGFSAFGDPTTLTNNLTAMNNLFQQIAGILQGVSSSSQDAASVTPANLQNISNAVLNAINSIMGVLQTAVPNFQTAGTNLMIGLATGITAGIPAVQKALAGAIPSPVGLGGGVGGPPVAAHTTYSPSYSINITAPGGSGSQIAGSLNDMLTKHDQNLVIALRSQ